MDSDSSDSDCGWDDEPAPKVNRRRIRYDRYIKQTIEKLRVVSPWLPVTEVKRIAKTLYQAGRAQGWNLRANGEWDC
jgi:hypothetical protein